MSGRKPLKGLLFDFDGLILDTETPIFQAWDSIFRQHGRQLNLDDWARILGKSSQVSGPVEEFLASFPDDESRTRIANQARELEMELILKQEPLPGAVELIKEARQRGLRLGVVSSSDRKWVESHLDRLGLLELFDHTSCADEVKDAKPDPALYRLGLQKAGLNPDQALALEDSPNGVLSAKRAGLTCFAVPNQITSQLPFYENGGTPDLVLISLEDFPWHRFFRDRA